MKQSLFTKLMLTGVLSVTAGGLWAAGENISINFAGGNNGVAAGVLTNDNGARSGLAANQIVNASLAYEAEPVKVSGKDNTLSRLTDWTEGKVLLVSGETTITMDKDLAFTDMRFEQDPAGAPASLTFVGDGTLWATGAEVHVTTDIPVTFTNGKANNPRITLSGSGDVTFCDGKAGVCLFASSYTGKLTLDGQQLTKHSVGNDIPDFTVGPKGATLHMNGMPFDMSAKVSGSGLLTLATGENKSNGLYIRNNASDFSGNITVGAGIELRYGPNNGTSPGEDAKLGTEATVITVKKGAKVITHLGGSGKTFAPSLVLEDGSVVGNWDGHVTYTGAIAVNGQVDVTQYWSKNVVWAGVVSGKGLLQIKPPTNDESSASMSLSNDANTFDGVIDFREANNRTMALTVKPFAGNAAPDIWVQAANTLKLAGDVTLRTFSGPGRLTSSDGTKRVLTLTGVNDAEKQRLDWTKEPTNIDKDKVSVKLASGCVLTTAAGTEAGLEVQPGATLVLKLDDTQRLDGYTSQAIRAEGAKVTFVDAENRPIPGVEDGVFKPATSILVIDAAKANWSDSWTGGVPGAGDAAVIEVKQDAELTLGADVTVGSLLVKGPGKLTIVNGNKLTVTEAMIVEGKELAANETTLTLPGAVKIADGARLSYAAGQALALPALTGSGTLVKTGAGAVNVAPDKDCEPTVDLQEGMLNFGSERYGKTYKVIARAKTTIQVGGWTGSLTSTASEITLEGDSKLQLNNGNTNKGSGIAAKIRIANASETPAYIQGSKNGSSTDLTGGITGEGTVEFWDWGDNRLKVSGSITDGASPLKVKVAFAPGKDGKRCLELAGNNTYTGGTEIIKGAKLLLGRDSALGTGAITGAGVLTCGDGLLPSNRSGLTEAGWTGTVECGPMALGTVQESLESLGNAGSKLVLKGNVTGYLAKDANVCTVPVEIQGTLEIKDGYANKTYTFNKILGAGTLKLNKDLPYTVNVKDASAFTGKLQAVAGILAVNAADPVNVEVSNPATLKLDCETLLGRYFAAKVPVAVKVTGEGTKVEILNANVKPVYDTAVELAKETSGYVLNVTTDAGAKLGIDVATSSDWSALKGWKVLCGEAEIRMPEDATVDSGLAERVLVNATNPVTLTFTEDVAVKKLKFVGKAAVTLAGAEGSVKTLSSAGWFGLVSDVTIDTQYLDCAVTDFLSIENNSTLTYVIDRAKRDNVAMRGYLSNNGTLRKAGDGTGVLAFDERAGGSTNLAVAGGELKITQGPGNALSYGTQVAMVTVDAGAVLNLACPTGSLPLSDAEINLVNNGTVKTNCADVGTRLHAVVSGSGTIAVESGYLQLRNSNTYAGGTMVAADASLSVYTKDAIGTGALTLNGTLGINVPGDVASGTEVLQCANAAALDYAKVTGAPNGMKLQANEAGTAIVVVTAGGADVPEFVVPGEGAVAPTSEQAKVLADALTALGVTDLANKTVTLAVAANGKASEPATVAEDAANALEVFDNVAVVAGEGRALTLKVAYTFGVTSIAFIEAAGSPRVQLTATVDRPAEAAALFAAVAPAAFKAGVELQLMDTEGVIHSSSEGNHGGAASAVIGAEFDPVGTKLYRVKAVKAAGGESM